MEGNGGQKGVKSPKAAGKSSRGKHQPEFFETVSKPGKILPNSPF